MRTDGIKCGVGKRVGFGMGCKVGCRVGSGNGMEYYAVKWGVRVLIIEWGRCT